jgi:hypothetical protein
MANVGQPINSILSAPGQAAGEFGHKKAHIRPEIQLETFSNSLLQDRGA